MIEITFQNPQGGIYWVICERLSHHDEIIGYDLDSVLENSKGTGPASQITIPPNWQIKRIREV